MRVALTTTVVLVVASLLALGPNGAAHLESNEHGTLTFHDEADGASTDDLECAFFVMGHNMTSATGTLNATNESSTDNVTLGDYTGTPNDDGTFDFTEGPFELPDDGEWLVWADLSNATGNHTTAFHEIEYEMCEEEEEELPETCTGTLEAKAEDDGTVELEWERHDLADHYLVHMKRSDEANFTVIGNTTDDKFETGTLEADVTYQFRVTAHLENGTQIDDCGLVEATATVEEEEEEEELPDVCTGSLEAKAEDDATVELEWERNDLADHYLVHMKRSDEANFTVIGNTTDDKFDTGTLEVGVTYQFQVTAHAENGTQIDDCGLVEVTAIPYFGAVGALFATIGAIGAYAIVRRRR